MEQILRSTEGSARCGDGYSRNDGLRGYRSGAYGVLLEPAIDTTVAFSKCPPLNCPGCGA